MLIFSTFCDLLYHLTEPLDDIDRGKFVFGLYAKHKKILKEKRWNLMKRHFGFPPEFSASVDKHFLDAENRPFLDEDDFCGL